MQVDFFSDGLLRAVVVYLGIATGARLGQEASADDGETVGRACGHGYLRRKEDRFVQVE